LRNLLEGFAGDGGQAVGMGAGGDRYEFTTVLDRNRPPPEDRANIVEQCPREGREVDRVVSGWSRGYVGH
jgi:hypothetical protein